MPAAQFHAVLTLLVQNLHVTCSCCPFQCKPEYQIRKLNLHCFSTLYLRSIPVICLIVTFTVIKMQLFQMSPYCQIGYANYTARSVYNLLYYILYIIYYISQLHKQLFFTVFHSIEQRSYLKLSPLYFNKSKIV